MFKNTPILSGNNFRQSGTLLLPLFVFCFFVKAQNGFDKTPHGSVTISGKEVNPDDTVTVVAILNETVPIGWALRYECKTRTVKRGKIDSVFILVVAANSKEGKIVNRSTNKKWLMELVKSNSKRAEHFITHCENEKGDEWDVIKLIPYP